METTTTTQTLRPAPHGIVPLFLVQAVEGIAHNLLLIDAVQCMEQQGIEQYNSYLAEIVPTIEWLMGTVNNQPSEVWAVQITLGYNVHMLYFPMAT